MPEISVIVPVYKVEKYLDRCVESVLAQTFSDFELILVDDGSPDNCPAMCDNWAEKDSRIRVLHKQNGGLSSARNAGIDAACGDYLFFVDSDDVIHSQTLQMLFNSIKSTDSQVSIGKLTRFNEGELPDLSSDISAAENSVISGQDVLHCFFNTDYTVVSRFVSACCKLFSKSLFDELRFPVGRLFEDEYTTYISYYRSERIALVEADMYFYYVNDSGITGTLTLTKRFDEYDAQSERLEFFREKSLDELYNKALRNFLHTARWDLIACRENREPVDENRKNHFENQYENVFDIARKRKILNFVNDYDYYVLAKPKMVFVWRILRKLCLLRKG